jgi:hypothetical protein
MGVGLAVILAGLGHAIAFLAIGGIGGGARQGDRAGDGGGEEKT